MLTGSSEKDRAWLEEISQSDPVCEKIRILESKGPFLYKSFRWILDHEGFNRWRNTEKSGVFWIKGDPGKGKTMLLGGIVDNFKENPGNINLTYFFCQATDSRINSATAIIGGLIVSFIKQHQELRSYMHAKYKDKFGTINGPERWYILCDMFEEVTQHSAIPYPVCVIDALDECEQEHGRKKLLRLIIKTSCRIKWLISSRNITEIERELQAIDSSRRLSLELKENAEYVTKSVDLYINDSIQNIMALQGDEQLRIRATNTLKSKANGTFLWVALVVEQLRETKHRNVKKALEEMPEGLENLYNLILQRLAKQEERDAYRILLSTVTAAERPLRLEELRIFTSSEWKYHETTYTLRDLVKDCGSFLSIRDNTVYFIHQSVKDYMMGAASRVIFPSGIKYQHYEMFQTSISAMSRILKHNIYGLKDPGSDIDTISPPYPDPLAPIEYCCIFWVEHLSRSRESETSRDDIFLKDGRIIHSFLKVKYLCWLESLTLLRSLVPQGIEAIQKLKNLLSNYYKIEANRRHVGEMANPRGKREANRLRLFIHNARQLIRRYKDLCLGTYIDYAYTSYYYDESCLRAFINDAYRFSHHCKDYVRKYPLQLYHSALIFEDTQSTICRAFQQIIRTEFGNTLTLIKMPPKRTSLVQYIELNCRGSIINLLYSPDSSLLCSLSENGTISLCRTDTGTLERVIELDPEEICRNSFFDLQHTFLAFSINSKHLVSISITGIVHVWAVNCGTQMQKFSLNLNTRLIPRPKKSRHDINEIIQEEVIAISHYGDLTASVCRTLSGTVSSVKVWTIQTGECIHVIDQSHMPDISYADFSPNLTMIALSYSKDTRVYSVHTGKEIKYISNALYPRWGHMRPRFSPDSKLLVLKNTPGETYLWCTETWTMIHSLRSNLRAAEDFGLSPNAAMSVTCITRELAIESMDTGELLLKIDSHFWLLGCIFSPNWTSSSLFASFSEDAVQIWRAHINTKSSEIHNNVNPIRLVAISPESEFVAVLDDRGNIEIWNGESGEYIRVLQGNGSPYPHLSFSPNLKLMACAQGGEGDVQIWHIETGKPLHLLKGPNAKCSVHTAFSDDSRYVVAGYWTGQIKIWCVESGKCLYKSKHRNDYGKNISEVVFSPGSKYYAWASYGGHAKIRVWDWRSRHCIFRTELDRKSFLNEESFKFSSDGTVLIIVTRIRPSPPGLRILPFQYKVEFYGITSGALLGHIEINDSNCLPFFDPATDQIVSDRFRFCKRSSWKHWDTIPQPKYSCVSIGGEAGCILVHIKSFEFQDDLHTIGYIYQTL